MLYFLLAGEVSWGEAIACGITLAIACPFAVAVGRTGTVTMKVPGRGVWSLVRAVAAVGPELWRTGWGYGGGGAAAAGRDAGGVKDSAVSVRRHWGGRCGAAGGGGGWRCRWHRTGSCWGWGHERDEAIVHQLVPGCGRGGLGMADLSAWSVVVWALLPGGGGAGGLGDGWDRGGAVGGAAAGRGGDGACCWWR